jgi:hypothetical protein
LLQRGERVRHMLQVALGCANPCSALEDQQRYYI